MNNPAFAPSPIREPTGSTATDDMQTLRTGLELARASQLTMLRLQLALHKSNRRTAMQALDNLLEIDAEIEELAATLNQVPLRPSEDTALFGFIGSQKEAIATEKHVLTGSDLRSDPAPIAFSLADPDEASEAATPVISDDEIEEAPQGGGRRWLYILAAIIVIGAIICGAIAYFWPVLPMLNLL